uniref:IAA-ALANINE RESISTANCE protein 1 n=1 Tax=Rhizophora mucronata TaxID=61149 RepID=A0A2P2MV30_RHIMU
MITGILYFLTALLMMVVMTMTPCISSSSMVFNIPDHLLHEKEDYNAS